MNKYEVIIYWSEEDEAFVAEVPNSLGAPRTVPVRKRRSPAHKKPFACGSIRRRSLAIRFQSPGVVV